MTRRISTVFSIVVLALPGLAAGQSTLAQKAAAERRESLTVRSKALLEKAPDPTVTNGIVTPDAKFTFAAGPDGKEARVQIGVQSGALTTTLSFKGRLNPKGDTALLGVTGLSADTTGAIAVSYSRWHPKVDEARAAAVCETFAVRRLTIAGTRGSGCSISALASEPDLQRAQALAVHWSLPLIVGAKYEMGRSSFEFVDARTGADQPTAFRTPVGASGTIGTIFENGTALALTVERQRSYRAGTPAQLCTDLSASIKKCSDAVLGGPSTSDATLASISVQRAGKNVGVQPRVSYRWTTSGRTTSVDVPIYVLQNKSNGLNGGVSLGWRTKDGARAVLFVGVMTDLFRE